MLYYQVSFCICWVLFICKGSTNFIESIHHSGRITQQKEHLLIWNSETTQNLNIYLHNYQTQTAIFLATNHEKKTIGNSMQLFKFFNTENTSKQQMVPGFCEELLSENYFEAVLINFGCYEYIIVPMLLRQFRSKD